MAAKKTGVGADPRHAEFLQIAREAAKKIPQYIDLHNHLQGNGAIYGQMFKTKAEREAFSASPEGAEFLKLMAARRKETGLPDAPQASGKFLLRVPASLHAALVEEAETEGVSLNQLCLAKLSVLLSVAVKK